MPRPSKKKQPMMIRMILTVLFIATYTVMPSPGWRNGRRSGFKIHRTYVREGSTPSLGIDKASAKTDQTLDARVDRLPFIREKRELFAHAHQQRAEAILAAAVAAVAPIAIFLRALDEHRIARREQLRAEE